MRALLLESGLWTALRTRPFCRVCRRRTRRRGDLRHRDRHAAARAAASRWCSPSAPRTSTRAWPRSPRLHRRSTSASPRARACERAGAGVQVVEFAGPHPAGNAGWHIHRLLPGRPAAQRLAHRLPGRRRDRPPARHRPARRRARGRAGRAGRAAPAPAAHAAGRVDRRTGARRAAPGRAARDLRLGARRAHRDGRGARLPRPLPPAGRRCCPRPRERELFGWIAPGCDKFSIWGVGARRLARRRAARADHHAPTAAPRAMVPIGSYERVMPLDLMPTFLLRALITGDDERAEALGALELDEDDLALCTFVCPGKTEYGPLLRAALDAHREGGRLMRCIAAAARPHRPALREGRPAASASTRCGRRPTPSSTRRPRSRPPARTCATRST